MHILLNIFPSLTCFLIPAVKKVINMASRRDITPFLASIRDMLLKRKNVNTLRFRDDISDRTQPPPNLPEGPHHKLSGNYYFTRDARREVGPPVLISDSSQPKKLSPGEGAPNAVARTPGPVYLWDV